jgi:hypothetical protein
VILIKIINKPQIHKTPPRNQAWYIHPRNLYMSINIVFHNWNNE